MDVGTTLRAGTSLCLLYSLSLETFLILADFKRLKEESKIRKGYQKKTGAV